MRYAEVRLSGSGGQGLGLAGRLLSEVAMAEDFNVCQTQSYGPEARGGASRTDVIVSKDEILFPNCRELDVLLAMNQESCTLFSPEVKESGIVIVDSGFVDQIPVGTVFKYPFTRTAVEKYKTALVANMIALGVMATAAGLFKIETWRRIISAKSPDRFRENNLEAFELGCAAGREMVKNQAVARPVAWDRKAPVPSSLKRKPRAK
jgi:2-oxoglutarate ferredoxin oxidoreductase subunit gamma